MGSRARASLNSSGRKDSEAGGSEAEGGGRALTSGEGAGTGFTEDSVGDMSAGSGFGVSGGEAAEPEIDGTVPPGLAFLRAQVRERYAEDPDLMALRLRMLPPPEAGDYVSGLPTETEAERSFRRDFIAAFRTADVERGMRECLHMINEQRDAPGQLVVFEVRFENNPSGGTADLVGVLTNNLELEEAACYEEVLRGPIENLPMRPGLRNGGEHTVTYPIWLAQSTLRERSHAGRASPSSETGGTDRTRPP